MAVNKQVISGLVSALFLSSGAYANNLYNELVFLKNNHPLIAASAAQKTGAQQNYRASRGAFMPRVQLSAQAGFEEQNRPNNINTSESTETARLAITQRVFDFGATSGAIDASEARVDTAVAVENQTTQDIIQAGIQSYFGLVFAYERLQNAQESVDRIRRQQDVEQAKIDQGSGSRADFLQAQSQLLSAQSRAATEQGALEIAQNRYLQVFGKQAPSYASLLKQAKPSSALPESLAAAESLASSNAPAVIAASANLNAAKEELDSTKATYYPSFDLVGEAEYRSDAQAVIGEVTENRVFLRMQYDFDLGLTRRGQVGAARANQIAANNEKINQERVAIEAVRSAWTRYQTALINFQISEQQLQSATEFLQLAVRERELGKRTLRDILNGELVRLNAKTRLAGARTELTTTAFDILRATGQLSLEAI